MASSMNESNNEIKEDFLEVDQSIPGQNYVCLSFVSPEKVIKNKEVFYAHKFLKTIAKKYDLDENTIEDQFIDFKYNSQDVLEKEFYEHNDFRTTVRGIKVRGVYDTQREAQMRAKMLQRKDPNFNVFLGQIGYWLPWDPNPHKIDNQEYAEQELNELVKSYRENQDKKDIHFQENIDYVKEQAAKDNIKKKAENAKNLAEENAKTITEETIEEVVNQVSDEASIKTSEEAVNQVSDEVKDSLNDIDPWMKHKMNNTQ